MVQLIGDFLVIFEVWSLKDGSFSFQRVLGDLLLGGGTISRPLKPIPLPKVTSDKKPLTLQFLGKLSDHR